MQSEFNALSHFQSRRISGTFLCTSWTCIMLLSFTRRALLKDFKSLINEDAFFAGSTCPQTRRCYNSFLACELNENQVNFRPYGNI